MNIHSVIVEFDIEEQMCSMLRYYTLKSEHQPRGPIYYPYKGNGMSDINSTIQAFKSMICRRFNKNIMPCDDDINIEGNCLRWTNPAYTKELPFNIFQSKKAAIAYSQSQKNHNT